MKKKLFLFISIFVFAISFNAKAYVFEEDTYNGNFDLKVLIHKSDEDGKGLEGATFTIKDLNGSYSLESYDKSDGDYLIENHLYGSDIHPTASIAVEDGQPYANLFDKLYKMMPKEYQDLFDSVSSYSDLETICNNNDYLHCSIDTYNSSVYFMVPMIIDETEAPSGYESGKWVVPAYYDFHLSNNLQAYFNVYIGYENEYFFEYDESVDYVKVLNELYSSDPESYEEYLDLLEEAGATIIDGCYSAPSRLDIEDRFSDDDLDDSCVMQLTDVKKKESKEEIKVNPATYGTVVVVLILLGGTLGYFISKQVKVKN